MIWSNIEENGWHYTSLQWNGIDDLEDAELHDDMAWSVAAVAHTESYIIMASLLMYYDNNESHFNHTLK